MMGRLKPYPEYKDSGVEWIGIVPDKWKLVKLKYLCQITTGSNDTQDRVDAGTYPFFVRSDKIERINEYTHDVEAVMTAGDGVGVGKVFHHFEGKFSAHQRVYLFTEFKNSTGKFIYYYLRSNLIFEVMQGTAKSTVDSLRRSMLSEFPVSLPNKNDQNNIVKYINSKTSQIDSLISDKERLIELLEEKRQAVITETVTKGLDPDAKMKDSGIEWIGEIPEHWEIRRFKYLFNIVKRIEYKENPKILSMTQQGIKERDISNNEGQIAQNYNNYQTVEINDFVMNHMDLITGFVDYSTMQGVTSPDYRVFKFINNQNNDKDYFLYYLQMCYYQNIFYGFGQGVAKHGRWRLQTQTFKDFLAPVPPNREQFKIKSKIKKEIRQINETIIGIKNIINKLKEYRESLIYEAVTGKIDVRDYATEAEKVN